MDKDEVLIFIELVHHALSIETILPHLHDPACGATVLFHGTARDRSAGERVLSLSYEAYEAMALAEMRRIAEDASSRWPLRRIAMVHRLGAVPIAEDAVVVGVSAPHRREAFEACGYLIDALKDRVPIWKTEELEKGSRWAPNPSLARP